jgi:hypothetical protein
MLLGGGDLLLNSLLKLHFAHTNTNDADVFRVQYHQVCFMLDHRRLVCLCMLPTVLNKTPCFILCFALFQALFLQRLTLKKVFLRG